jgi:hypothetical protein
LWTSTTGTAGRDGAARLYHIIIVRYYSRRTLSTATCDFVFTARRVWYFRLIIAKEIPTDSNDCEVLVIHISAIRDIIHNAYNVSRTWQYNFINIILFYYFETSAMQCAMKIILVAPRSRYYSITIHSTPVGTSVHDLHESFEFHFLWGV